MASELAQLDEYGEHLLQHGQGSGGVYLLKYLKEGPWGEAAQHVIWQFVIFYSMLLVGFLFLYLMIRSTSQLRELRKNVAETLRAQQARKFDVESYAGLAYGGAY